MNETPTAPATPALSQIRDEIEALIRRPYGCEPYGIIAQFTTLSQSLLSIAEMLERRDMAVKAALDECHQAFRDRKRGGVAEGTLRTRLEEIFSQPYQQTPNT